MSEFKTIFKCEDSDDEDYSDSEVGAGKMNYNNLNQAGFGSMMGNFTFVGGNNPNNAMNGDDLNDNLS
jgi:hypothetical protein